MKEIPNTLFSKQEINDLISKIALTPKQKNAAKEWKSRLDSGRIQIETQHEKEFADFILIQLLGFPDVGEGLEQKVNYMDYSVPPVYPNKGIVIELKSRGKDLFKEQLAYKNRPGKHTPVEQTIFYMRENIDHSYGICTNYEEFIFFKMGRFHQCYRFKFPKKGEKFTDEKIKEFVAIFSKKYIDGGKVEVLIKKTIEEQKTITEDFYQIYHETRQMMIKAFESNEKEQISKHNAIKYAQMFLNRLIFVFFAEDNNLITSNIFSDQIEDILKKTDLKDSTTTISTHIRTIFKWMDEGSNEIDHKLGFNGELFQTSLTRDAYFYDLKNPKFFESIKKLSKYKTKPKLNESQGKIIQRFKGKLNPIIENLLIMVGHDFKDKINVNILGHIFEQSIVDIEKLHGINNKEKNEKGGKKRKTGKKQDFGIYYTKEYITKFICQNTIIPHLSKNNVTEPDELILEYDGDLLSLENKIKSIKILDPACGSGAFLIQAVDILMDIYDRIQSIKQSEGGYQVSTKLASKKLPRSKRKKSDSEKLYTFDADLDQIKLRDIIQNNIYGVDINSESVEITKLSLFLKIASKNKRLFKLSDKIVEGNSLVNDEEIDGSTSFNWHQEFLEIFNKEIGPGGFDIIVGNPPYVQLSMNKELNPKLKEYLIDRYGSSMGRLNTFGFFTKLGIDLLNNNGILGFIIPNTILTQDYYEKLREQILTSCKINSITSFSDMQFKAVVENVIFTLQKTDSENKRMKNISTIYGVDDNLNFGQQNQIEQRIFANSKKQVFGISWNPKLLKFRAKMDSSGLLFNDYLEINQGIALKEDRDRHIVKDRTDDRCRRILDGAEINRYSLTWAGDYLVYDIDTIHSCKREDIFITTEKLLFRRTGNSLIATYDDKKFYALNTLVVMNKKQGVKHDILFFLALFNSKLLNYYYRTFLKSTKKVFSEIQARQVENLPIQIPNDETQEKIVKLVKKIINLKKQLGDAKNEPDKVGMLEEDIIRNDDEINNEIYKIYNLTESEIKTIE